jgi:tryptophan synthase alpha chain
MERLRAGSRKGLICYLTAGDPTPDLTPALVQALERGGADVVELGVPFSDPIADGPVIQRAGQRALKAGTNLRKVLEIAARVRMHSEIPLLLFTYLNPVLRYGFAALARDAAAAGIDGCLLTDVSVEEAHDYVGTMRSYGLDTVFLAAPTSTDHRLKLVAEYSRGFVYLVSRTGVTGKQNAFSEAASPLVARVRRISDLPLALGFGISRAEHVREAAQLADAVVVGSAIVSVIERSGHSTTLEAEVEAFVSQLRQGIA